MGQLCRFNYLKDHEKGVKVPIIQRDYAQGREEETEKRKRFLDSLHKAREKRTPTNLSTAGIVNEACSNNIGESMNTL